MKKKIDFIITWVDGNDPQWRAERERYISEKELSHADNRMVRFRDMDILRYWFRTVEKYAAWVNKIHFVTWGHIPEWLDTSNSKLNIVKHTDFIPEKYLPTFSSRPIELNFHRIKGLSEQFVFFNDEMFLINPVRPEDFFIKGKPCDCAILSPVFMPERYGTGNLQINNIGIINSHFNKDMILKDKTKYFNIKYELKELIKNIMALPWDVIPGYYEPHICTSFLKETYNRLWDEEYDILDETCTHRFRNVKLDVNEWLMRDWQLASGNFVPRSTSFGRYYQIDSKMEFKKIIFDKKTKVICLNDNSKLTGEEFEKTKRRIKTCFNHMCPDKSSFERI